MKNTATIGIAALLAGAAGGYVAGKAGGAPDKDTAKVESMADTKSQRRAGSAATTLWTSSGAACASSTRSATGSGELPLLNAKNQVAAEQASTQEEGRTPSQHVAHSAQNRQGVG